MSEMTEGVEMDGGSPAFWFFRPSYDLRSQFMNVSALGTDMVISQRKIYDFSSLRNQILVVKAQVAAN
jgi:hypothetical protein